MPKGPDWDEVNDRLAAVAEKYMNSRVQYEVVEANAPVHLRNKMNRLADDGYKLSNVPLVVDRNGSLIVIMEKDMVEE